MHIVGSAQEILGTLRNYLSQIDDHRYGQPLEIFSGATLGQHTRHILEFFLCLTEQSEVGEIDYDARQRDQTIEEHTSAAIEELDNIVASLPTKRLSDSLNLKVSYSRETNEYKEISTSFERELSYNIEHAIHHMAIIKIGLKAIAPDVDIPDHFGVAPSTIKFQRDHVHTDLFTKE